jgi:hypothetical protein
VLGGWGQECRHCIVMIGVNRLVEVMRQTVNLRLKPSVTEKDDKVGT